MTPGLSRRRFLALSAQGLAVGGLAMQGALRPIAPRKLQAIALDAFAVFDPRPIADLGESLFPGKGNDLADAWRMRQFEYQWLRALSGRYADFWQTTEEALVFAARSIRVQLDPESRFRLMQAHLGLEAWPEVPSSLRCLKGAGVRLALLSNMTGKMLMAGINNARMEGLFEHVLSTDDIHSYKPSPRAYQLALDALHLDREAVLFVASAGWDAAGAKWFGYPTFWVNRLDLPAEQLGVTADAVGRDFHELVSFVITGPKPPPAWETG